jgi:hypothetical protein
MKWISLLALLAATALMAGCEDQPSIEEQAEDTSDSMQDAAENAGDRMQGAADETGDRFRAAGEEIEEGAEDSAQAVKRIVFSCQAHRLALGRYHPRCGGSTDAIHPWSEEQLGREREGRAGESARPATRQQGNARVVAKRRPRYFFAGSGSDRIERATRRRRWKWVVAATGAGISQPLFNQSATLLSCLRPCAPSTFHFPVFVARLPQPFP